MRVTKGRFSVKRCYAKNCKVRETEDSNVTLHRFPKDIERCKEWVRFANNSQLLNQPLETLWKFAFLCRNHFTADQYYSNHPGRLLSNSLPTVPSSSPSSIQIPSTSKSPSTSAAIETAQHLQSSLETPVTSSSSCPPSIPLSKPFADHISNLDISLSTPSCSSPSSGNLSSKNVPQSFNMVTSPVVHPTPGPSSLAVAASSTADGWVDARSLNRRYRANNLRKLFLMKKIVKYLEKESKREPKGRRTTIDEFKSYCNFYEQNRPLFQYVRKNYFPNPKTFHFILSSVHFKAGINPGVVKHLSSRVSEMFEEDKHCVLLFGKMPLKPRFAPNSRSDNTEGSVDHGDRGRSTVVAREALVFMVRGLRLKWKQPVAFFFCKKATPGVNLAHHIIEVLDALHNTGVKIAATVCDISSNNIKALKILGYTPKKPFLVYNGQKIFTLHNPPDLLKSTRNVFLKYPVRVRAEGEMLSGLARWSHLQDLYNRGEELRSQMIVGNKWDLTEAHLNPNRQQKKELEFATEVFSCPVRDILLVSQVNGRLPMETTWTVHFLSFVISLYGSLNGERESGINLFSSVKKSSPHLDFWKRAAEEISEWEFLEEGRRVRPKCTNGWIITIKAVRLLWKKLEGAGFSRLEPSRLNLDPLENFFSRIRSCCGTSGNPTMRQFESAFKSIVTNDILPHWLRQLHCTDEDDLIAELQEFIKMIPDQVKGNQ